MGWLKSNYGEILRSKRYESFHIDYGGVNSHKDVGEMKTGERLEMRCGEVEVKKEIVKSYIGDAS